MSVNMNMDERAIRALHSAVVWTLTNWSGQGDIDQAELYDLRTFLQGAIFEFDLARPYKDL